MPEKPLKRKKLKKEKLGREDLLAAGEVALDLAVERLQGRYTSRPDKIALMRVIGNLVGSIGGVLKDVDLDDLLERVEALEEVNKKSE